MFVKIAFLNLTFRSAMFISANEKQKEFAVMRAIGISDRSIMKIVVYESVFISISGALTGLILLSAILAGLVSGIIPTVLSNRANIIKVIGGQ